MRAFFTIRQMLISFVIVAIGCAAIANDNKNLSMLWFNVVIVTLLFSILGSMFRTGPARAHFAGYSLGVAAYLISMFVGMLATSAITVPFAKRLSQSGERIRFGDTFRPVSFNSHMFFAILVGLICVGFAHYHVVRSESRTLLSNDRIEE